MYPMNTDPPTRTILGRSHSIPACKQAISNAVLIKAITIAYVFNMIISFMSCSKPLRGNLQDFSLKN